MINKSGLIVGIVVLAVVASVLTTYLILRPNPTNTTAIIGNALGGFSASTSPTGQTSDASRLKRLSTSAILGASISADGRAVNYLSRSSGQLLATDFSGRTSTANSSISITNGTTALWSASGDKLLAQQRRSNQPAQWQYFNLTSSQHTTLNQNISTPVFSPNGSQIAYLYFDPAAKQGGISLAQPDGSDFTTILPTRQSDLVIDWLNADQLLFSNRTGETAGIFSLDINTKKLNKIISDNSTASFLAAPDGSKVLYQSKEDSNEATLALYDRATDTTQTIGLVAQPNQCTWSISSTRLFCAGTLASSGASDPAFFQIDLKNKTIHQISGALSHLEANPTQPFLSPAEDYLIFTNQTDNYLYSFKL